MQLKARRLVIAIIAVVIVLLGVIMTWHQHTHFNRNTTVNGVAVGGMITDEAYQKVKATDRTNDVYLDGKLIYNGQASGSGITSSDKDKFVAAQKKQRTFFPSGKKQNVLVTPEHSSSQTAAMRDAVETAVQEMNKGRKAPVDAYAKLENGKISTIAAKKGNQYDTKNLLKQFDNKKNNGTVRLTAHYTQPLTADSKAVQNEKTKLKDLVNKKISYKVENEIYKLNSNDIITSATYQNGKYSFNTHAVNNQIAKINNKQATLGKSFKFRTHSGKEITTSDKGSYGWKISDQRAGQSLAQAVADGKKTVNAKADIYGIGYNRRGTGYGVTANNGIGNTYVELSLADQHVWFYKNGKCVFDADVVTGSNTPGNRTPKGVWYIMYQQSPATLRGSNDDGSLYSSPVQYWSPFTDTGCGFHDASWRNNWSKTEYLTTTGGSHGCANMHPADAGTAYHDMEINEPVVIY